MTLPSTHSDEQLARMLADSATRRQAFEMLVGRYAPQLYWKVRSIVVSHDDADDVVQNTFLKAWAAIDDFQAKAKLSTWLYRIAVNEAIDFLRRRRRQEGVEQGEALVTAERLLADPYFDGDRTEAILQEAVAALPEVQRTVFVLRYYHEMKYADISKMLGTSEGALKASYHIAVGKIKEYVRRAL